CHVREWAIVMRDKELAAAIGFVFIEEVEEQFRDDLSEIFANALPRLNQVSRPEGLILVEGQTEVGLLPATSLKRGLPLIQKGIKVFDCEGKQHMPKLFKKFKKEFPKIPIVCLLDEDAQEEWQEIERMVRGAKNKYAVVRLNRGTIEDVLPLHRAVQALNKLYPAEQVDEIRESDFDERLGFVENAKQVLWRRRQTSFDQKSRFGFLVGLCLEKGEIPPEVEEVIDSALLLVDASHPMRLSRGRSCRAT
ncbi:MAG TPA: TOPRIM nucleotidyl transferase/hydrolase domain-containing protein, partial [Desulfomonilaceae bacterium]|nr:TOPRIM nucleotidyl transferase/hydrolase domain-containing protein [Desulfomonilaceae bacterium]